MASLVFRLCVLLLSVLIQVGSWRAAASSSTSIASASPPALGDFDAPEEDDLSEEVSAVDDAFDTLIAGSYHPGCAPAPSARFRRAEAGLPTGGPTLDAPFKPPRG